MESDIYSFRYPILQKFIFLTFEWHTFQPDSKESEPDIENMQVIGTARAYSRQEAYDILVKENEYLMQTTFNEIWCFCLAEWGDYNCMFSLEETREQKIELPL